MHTLKAKLRLKGKAGFLRRQGWIPAVVYGPTVENTPLVIDRKDLQDLFSQITRSSRINLSIKDHSKGKKLDVFIKSIQYDSITDQPIHVDFYHPEIGSPLKLYVPIKITGEASGIKEGGMLNVLFRGVQVHGLPNDIPHLITIDVSDLEIGDVIRVRDIDFGNVEPFMAQERALVTVMAPRRLEEEVVTEAEEEGEELAGEETEETDETKVAEGEEEPPAEGE